MLFQRRSFLCAPAILPPHVLMPISIRLNKYRRLRMTPIIGGYYLKQSVVLIYTDALRQEIGYDDKATMILVHERMQEQKISRIADFAALEKPPQQAIFPSENRDSSERQWYQSHAERTGYFAAG
jgi:hypothetical protein